jgi:hypothetical protein
MSAAQREPWWPPSAAASNQHHSLCVSGPVGASRAAHTHRCKQPAPLSLCLWPSGSQQSSAHTPLQATSTTLSVSLAQWEPAEPHTHAHTHLS